MAISIQVPLSREEARKLKSGDSCLLSGVIYTARDAAHKRLCELIEQGKELPFDKEYDMTEDDANILRQGKLERDSRIVGLFQNQLVSTFEKSLFRYKPLSPTTYFLSFSSPIYPDNVFLLTLML